ncbi:LOW QUALITY PROTEIN: probable 28S ribosomal protein S25, mitochondrial [Uloborus diversus]|uniref:LOW QUALITY PROTEIN: probable 28S ribosomal protein S25, mitochondrial n=1 Tax=Uloborus diversus TaxID=327109 RepID=UPI00240999A0|nr:LOW QUALITY PROTEIN: probable 28S ribosomal protein S25, mitochondrial [Uloborus diversus]
MPYMLGTNAIRRTRQYLEQGKLFQKKHVKIMTINYNEPVNRNIEKISPYHQGAKDFVHWNLCQVQYKNPDVQVIFMKNKFPTPFVRCWLDNGDDVIMDIFGKTNVEILDQLIKVLGQPVKAKAEEQKDTLDAQGKIAEFGSGRKRHCMCEIPGQVPCPAIVPLPKTMTGKYRKENSIYPPKGFHCL